MTGQIMPIGGPATYKGPESTPMLDAGVLIDAQTGAEIFSWQQGTPIG